MNDLQKQKRADNGVGSTGGSAPFVFTADQIVVRLRCFSDGAEFQKDEWQQALFAQAADTIDRLTRETLNLRAALAYVADEANRHHEHNPITGKTRQARGYIRIRNIAAEALIQPNTRTDAPTGRVE